MTRSPEVDRALCLHEAAHAVTAEVLRPGCVIQIVMDYVPGTPTPSGHVFGEGTEAVCSWTTWSTDSPDWQAAVAAGREGEKILESYAARARHDEGDQYILREASTSSQRRRARRRAAALVRKHEAAVRRVARALESSRVMTGDEIRAEIARFA